MSQKQVSVWLKGITISIGIMGILFFFLVMPYLLRDVTSADPKLADLFVPGLVYGWCLAIFCYAILWQFWKVCVEIGRDNTFSRENAKSFVNISHLSILLAALLFCSIVFLAIVHCLGAAFLLFVILLIFICAVLAVLAAALSHLIYKSYEMKQEQDLTI